MKAFILTSRISPCIRPISSSNAKKELGESSPHLLQNPSWNRRRYYLAWPHQHPRGRISTPQKQLRRNRQWQGVVVGGAELSPAALGMSIRSAYELEPDDSGGHKDEAALYRRTVYDHESWTHHRSSLRHGLTILSMAGSKVILALGPPVSGLTLVAAALAFYNEMASLWMFSWFPLLHVSALPFQLLAPALALLLVFRTNASYARYDEARRAWGSNVTRTRDLTRQALCWIRHPSDAERVRKLLRHCGLSARNLRFLQVLYATSTIAYCYCMKSHMLREGNLKQDLTDLLEEEELEALLAAPHQPIFCLMMMSEILHSCNISDTAQALMSDNITHFFDNLGACERIFKTPIPLSYTRLTSRLLVVWHVALPLALWDQCKWAAVPATALSAAVLFCIEEVGVLIEEPFRLFPLEILCTLAGENVDDLVKIHEDYLLDCKKHTKCEFQADDEE